MHFCFRVLLVALGLLIAPSRWAHASDGQDSLAPATAADPVDATAAKPVDAATAEPVDATAAESSAPSDTGSTTSSPESAEPPTDTGSTTSSPESAEPLAQPGPATSPVPAPPAATDTEPGFDPMARHRFIHEHILLARYNALGLGVRSRIGYRMQLLQRNTKLFADTFFAARLQTILTPSYGRVGPLVELQPLAILNIAASYELFGTFNAVGILQSFGSPNDPYSDTTLREGRDEGQSYATYGGVATLTLTLQMKISGLVLRSALEGQRFDMKLRGNDTVFYEQLIDLLVPAHGFTLKNDADALWQFKNGLTAGVRHSLAKAFYRDSDYRPGEDTTDRNGPTHRLGPMLAYSFFQRPGRAFNEPTLLLLTQWWIQHRYRTGVDTHVGIPCVLLGFSFKGDLPGTRGAPRKKKAKA